MSDLKILITGGSGFIGRNITESFLSEKHRLFHPTSTQLDLTNDTSVVDYFAHHSFDVVIHAAAKPSHRNVLNGDGVIAENSRMFFNLLHHQHAWGKLLLIGSGAIYDLKNYQPKMPESYFGTHIPKDPHGYTKYIIGKQLISLENVYDLRVFGLYGKYEDYAIRFISNAICKTLFDLPITLRQDRLFDYVFIEDFVQILDHFIENSPMERAFNITPDTSAFLLEIAQLVNQLAGNKHAIRVGKTGLGTEYSGSNELLRKELPDFRFTSLEAGIAKLYNWYSGNPSLIDKQLLLFDK